MALTNKSKSILLQVAFKAAADQEFSDNTDLMNKTDDFYQVLLSLHEKYEIDGDVAPSGGGGAQEDAPITTIDGTDYYDYRGLKSLGAIENPNFPDFKRVTDSEGFWLTKKDGSPTKFAQTVAAAGV